MIFRDCPLPIRRAQMIAVTLLANDVRSNVYRRLTASQGSLRLSPFPSNTFPPGPPQTNAYSPAFFSSVLNSFQSLFCSSSNCWYTSYCSSAGRFFQLASMLASSGAEAFERVEVTLMGAAEEEANLALAGERRDGRRLRMKDILKGGCAVWGSEW
jgi:hypothetical protein